MQQSPNGNPPCNPALCFLLPDIQRAWASFLLLEYEPNTYTSPFAWTFQMSEQCLFRAFQQPCMRTRRSTGIIKFLLLELQDALMRPSLSSVRSGSEALLYTTPYGFSRLWCDTDRRDDSCNSWMSLRPHQQMAKGAAGDD